MMKLLSVFLAGILLALCAGSLGGGMYFSGRDDMDHMANVIGVSLSGCETEVYRDDHTGFHGDGEAYGRVSCDADTLRDVEANAAWHAYPMDPEFERHLRTHPMYFDLSDALDAGDWWFVLDRQAEGDARYSPDGILYGARASHNYCVAIYDSDEHMLWYYEYDS